MLQQLIDYIKKEREKGFSDNDIRQALLSVGYAEDTIYESFEYMQKKDSGEISHEEKKIVVNEITDHKIDKGKIIFVAGCIVLSITILCFLIFSNPTKDFSLPALKDSESTENTEVKIALSKIDLNEGKTYAEVKTELEKAVADKKIKEGSTYKETYENFREYKEEEIVKEIERKIKKGEIEKNENFSKTLNEYIEIKKKETVLLQAAEKAVESGIIENKTTKEDLIEEFEKVKEEIIQNNTEQMEEEKEVIPVKERSPEYGSCVAEIKFKNNTCNAAITRNKSICGNENSEFFKDECLVFFYRSEMVLHKNPEVCNSVPEDLKLQCLAIANRDKTHCEKLPESAKFGCMISVDVASKVESKDPASCSNKIIDYQDVCLAVLGGNTNACNTFDISVCDIYS